MNIKLKLIVAVSENMGIGVNGDIPWKLRKEMGHFSRMTKQTKDPGKQNAVVMGRKTWESIPVKNRPLAGRLNIVLSTQNLMLGSDVLVFNSLDGVIQKLQERPLTESVESVWIIGGSSVYKEALASPLCHRIYLTKVFKSFECDTFLPEIPRDTFRQIMDPEVSEEVQEENSISYCYQVHERLS